jgi:hypothetical protein
MYSEPNFEGIKSYIKDNWTEASPFQIEGIVNFAKQGFEIYQRNIEPATELVKKLLSQERPFIAENNLKRNAPKIAQEQLRVFLSTIFPTRLDYTTSLVGLVSLYKSAWSPVMRQVTHQMAELVLAKHPEIEYMFRRDENETQMAWSPEILAKKGVIFNPQVELLAVTQAENFIKPTENEKHPLDLLHFHPKYMANGVAELISKIEVSLMTMGQDQRHRTIKRSAPILTGNFYLPPVCRQLGLEKEASDLLEKWYSLREILPDSLLIATAPYGLMASYQKSGELNAIVHEMEKRFCWCAQQEIYETSLQLYKQIVARGLDNLLPVFQPPCFKSQCLEGERYCGRDLSLKNEPDKFFVSREV